VHGRRRDALAVIAKEPVAGLAKTRLVPALGETGAARAAAAMLADTLTAVRASGADTPHIPVASYRRAFALLDEADLVLGPALDGGYYLVAAKASRPELFVGVPMGTEVVLAATLTRAARGGLRVALLPPLRDLDRVEDLAAALDGGELDAAPATRAAAAELLASAGAGVR
jgi:glycosyltransferase A (GT-A) superfamily protein (DUF2064 family)